MIVRTDCRFFKGDIPCRPHKDQGLHCEGCSAFEPVKERILIIKLGAIGDVIRTTPLLVKLKEVYPQAEISWLTHYPEVVPGSVDKVYIFELKDILALMATPFDIVYNLDKDREVCALVQMITADSKKGFLLSQGKCSPLDDSARHKWLTGLFDDVSRDNTKSYPQEIFEICGFNFNREPYILDKPTVVAFKDLKEMKILIGLNTGCGGRWKTRLWPEEYWIELAWRLKHDGKEVVLLGGPDEDAKNRRIAEAAGCLYPGHFPFQTFVSLVDACALVVTGVTMAMHVAIGLKKKLVLFNNIFNRNEFELYGLGTIVEPSQDCLCCYKTECATDCMREITPERVIAECDRLLNNGNHV
ncbi:MAG: glycosyltransferase family 9 protein [Nitrospirae bacterium]|nr:glycosyltransferase family 9 protein [Nitrospirota bacterium]